jgi:adenosylhomocysteine nucleosidase
MSNYYNVAGGNANVRQQVGEVKGDFYAGKVTTGGQKDLADQIAELRRDISQARIDGTIDEEYAEAFEQEIDGAERHLPIQNDESKRGFVLSMQRAKGLAEGLADLTVKVTAAIAAARGIL